MPPLEDVVIISGCRTPVGKFQGSLSDLSAPQLGAIVVREAVKRANLGPQQVDECIMGNVVSAGLGQNPARQAALRGGLPPEVGAMTINKVCGSGLKAVALAARPAIDLRGPRPGANRPGGRERRQLPDDGHHRSRHRLQPVGGLRDRDLGAGVVLHDPGIAHHPALFDPAAPPVGNAGRACRKRART